jgi:hypothetical protein
MSCLGKLLKMLSHPISYLLFSSSSLNCHRFVLNLSLNLNLIFLEFEFEIENKKTLERCFRRSDKAMLPVEMVLEDSPKGKYRPGNIGHRCSMRLSTN